MNQNGYYFPGGMANWQAGATYPPVSPSNGVNGDVMQQRLMMMQQQQQAAQQPLIRCRAVTSQEEASAAMIELDGTLNIFVDVVNNKIYSKQIGLNGTAVFNVYKLSDDVNEKEQEVKALHKKVDGLENTLKGLLESLGVPAIEQNKKGVENNEQ